MVLRNKYIIVSRAKLWKIHPKKHFENYSKYVPTIL